VCTAPYHLTNLTQLHCRLYYQYLLDTSPHALLHIADSIEAAGNIDQYVREVAQLAQIKMNHHLHESLAPKLGVSSMFASDACEYVIV
jgi:hypothetical protein